jgi:gliding motility-associated-like protein
VLPTLITNLTESICQGGSFTVGNQSFSQTGNYQVILTANNGCDSTVNLNLTVLPTFTTNLNESICQGGSFTIGNQSFSQTGNYQVILTANNGCDSTVNLDLTVLPTFTTNLTESICQGSSYTVGNQSFNQTGNYQVILTANNGCDSTVNLNLTVLPTFTTNLNESICQGGSFTIGNQGFNQTGNYSVTLSAFGGCDSIVNLNLTVYQNPNAMIFGPKSVCLGLSILLSAGVFDTYAWSPGGETSSSIPVTTGGSYTVTVTDSNGCTASASTNIAEEICNSVVAAFSISQDTACASHFVQFNNASIGNSSLLWNFGNGNFSSEPNPSAFYPEPGTYTVTLIAGNGAIADTARQQVYVYPKIEAAFFTVTADICQPKSLIFNDNSLSTFGLTGWSWNFGDGAAANSAIAKHDYTNFDTVNVTHVIFDKFGCTDSINQDVIVTDAGTTPSPVHLCLNLCEGDSIVVENTVFNASNPAGSMTLTTASGCDSTVTVELTFQPLKQTALMPDFSICENESATLNAGSGTSYLWSNGATSQTIVVTPASPGTYEVTVSNSNECPEVRTVSISVDEIPGEDAAAGTDISVCETTKIVALAAQPPASATGSWTTLTDAEINNTANPVSTVSNLSTGENYFIWTLNNGACKGFSADTVVVRVIAEATEVAQAGDDQSFCSSVTSIQLASTPPQGTGITGTWSQPSSQEQLGVQIAEPGNPHSPVAGFYPNNTYLFTWTLTNGACGAYSFDNVLVSTYAGLLPPADAGDDLNLCTGVETTLKGNLPPGTIGEWAALDSASDAFISQPFNASTLVSDLAAGGNAFVWTLSGNDCPSYSSDTVQVFLSEGLVANEDVYFNLGQPLTRLDFLANDEIPDRRNVTLTFLSTPLYGSLRANANDTYDFTFGVDTTENIEFTYEICLKDCPDVCDQAQVLILSKSPLPPPAIRKPANVITPNGDATGERFAIPNYSDIPPPIEMTVINRWGNVVFHEKDYQNDWNGKSQRGKQLPDGTYYYILKGGGSEVSGSVTIVR